MSPQPIADPLKDFLIAVGDAYRCAYSRIAAMEPVLDERPQLWQRVCELCNRAMAADLRGRVEFRELETRLISVRDQTWKLLRWKEEVCRSETLAPDAPISQEEAVEMFRLREFPFRQAFDALVQLYSAIAPPPLADSKPAPVEPNAITIPENPSLERPEPSEEAFKAYRAQIATGKNQTELAEFLTGQLQRPISQVQVSRWLSQVKEWLEAGNVLPDLPTLEKKPAPIDRARIDLGEQLEGRTPLQRQRRTDDN
jgi:hypothetical protein